MKDPIRAGVPPGPKIMRRVASAIAGVLIVVGGVWSLQGVGILPGSFMTGQLRWAGYGVLAICAGLLLAALTRRPTT